METVRKLPVKHSKILYGDRS